MRRTVSVMAVLVALVVVAAPLAAAAPAAAPPPSRENPTIRVTPTPGPRPPATHAALPRRPISVLETAKFALHAGLAAGAFHRYIYKPFKAGTFRSGAMGRRVALVKAGLAGLFAYHELKLAIKNAQGSKLLRPLVAPANALAARFQGIGNGLKAGKFNPADIGSANGQLAGLTKQAARAGIPIKDLNPPANLRPKKA
jgi:hypothetical protein